MRKLIVIIAIAALSFSCASTNETHYRIGVKEADAFHTFLNEEGVEAVAKVEAFNAGKITKEELYGYLAENYPTFIELYAAVLESKLDKTDYEMQVLDMMISFLVKIAATL